MDRLTCRIDAGVVVAASDMRNAMKRLAAYEDTGLTPEEIQCLINSGVVRVDPEAKMYGGNFHGQTGGEGNRNFE